MKTNVSVRKISGSIQTGRVMERIELFGDKYLKVNESKKFVIRCDSDKDLSLRINDPIIYGSDDKAMGSDAGLWQRDPGEEEFVRFGTLWCSGNPSNRQLIKLDISAKKIYKPGKFIKP